MYDKLCELIEEREIQYQSFIDNDNKDDWLIVLTLRNNQGNGRLFHVLTPETKVVDLWWLT